ncbi:MAG: tetratricopeptide repeat protein [Magnetovibrionaceae bacterium]
MEQWVPLIAAVVVALGLGALIGVLLARRGRSANPSVVQPANSSEATRPTQVPPAADPYRPPEPSRPPLLEQYDRLLQAKGLPDRERDALVRDFARQAGEITDRLNRMEAEDGSKPELEKARARLNAGDLVAASQSLEVFAERDGRAAQDMKQAVDRRLATAAMAKVVAGDLALAQLDYDQAQRHYLQAAEWLPEGQDGILAECYNKHGTAAYQSGDNEQATASFSRALKVLERHLGASHPDVATALNNLALLHYTRGDYGAAEPLYRRALAIDEEVLGKDHTGVATDLNNLALLYKKQGNFQAAKPLLARALAIKEKHFPPGHPSLLTGYRNLAALLRALGDDEAAASLEAKAQQPGTSAYAAQGGPVMGAA